MAPRASVLVMQQRPMCLALWPCALVCCCLLSLCAAQESHACDIGGDGSIRSRVEALEARLQAVLESGGARAVPGITVFPKGDSSTGINPDRYIVARTEPSWHTIANFMVAVAIESPVSAVHLPQEQPAGGLQRHFFVGDVNGKLHMLSMSGSILLEHQTDGVSPITAVSEGKFRSNATHVVTGHADGCVRWHLLEHSPSTRTAATLAMHTLPGNSFCPNASAPDPNASIRLVTLGKVYPKQRKLAAVAVTEGNTVLMLRERSQAPVTAQSSSAVLHVQLEHRQVQLLTEQGFAYVMLHSANATVRPISCTGINETRLLAAAPDLQRPARAYGVSSTGELVGLALSGQNRISSCRVRVRRDTDAVLAAANMAVIRAGAIVTGSQSLYLLNTTHPGKGRQQTMKQQLAGMPRSFGVFDVPELSGTAAISADAEGRVLVQLGDHMVALYHHPTPQETVANPVDWIKWARPVILLCMVTFGVFQFSRRGNSYRAEAATAQLRPELLRAQQQLYTNQRRMR